MNNLFLSICIPTYNRIDKTLLLVKSILEYEGNDIEIVVLDNCSTDKTKLLLENIKDIRFRYLRNNQPIGGMQNILTSLTHGRGKYVLLCLDKDKILADNLNEFIVRLKKIEVVAGQCALNIKNFRDDIIFYKGVDSVSNFAYTSEHPSGLFINNDLLKKNEIIKKIVATHSTFSFLPELLKAEISLFGKTARINMPFVYTETLEECEKEVSHSYTGDNIYFLPNNIIQTFETYITNLQTLDLSNKQKKNVLMKITSSLLINSTIGFKNIMKNKSICLHHGINTRNISVLELARIYFLFFSFFFQIKTTISFIDKLNIFIVANIKIVYVFFRSKLKL
jgi:glycosyltransferase involved in cell wall biosynthesis